MKKHKEQASAVTETAEFPETGRLPKFDGTVNKVMVNEEWNFIFLSTHNSVKATTEGFWLGGNKDRVTRTDEMRAEYRGAESCRASSADSEGL